MNEIQLFNFDDNQVRTVLRDGEARFVTGDVCDVLGIQRVSDALKGLDDDEKGADTIRTLGGDQQVSTINESGLYSLVLRSRKPEAKRFKKWITAEVLPTIRKTGGAYITPGSQAELDLTNPDTALDKLIEIAQVAKEARARNAELEAKAAIDAPKVMLAEEFFNSDGLMGYRETARGFGLRQSDLMGLLRGWGWVELSTRAAKAYAVQQGYAKNLVFYHPSGQEVNGKLTRKGVERVAYKLENQEF